MSAPLLLIDGYNLIYAARMAPRSDAPGELQRSREELLAYLGDRLTAAERTRAVVVFDARDPPPFRPATTCVRGVRIIFALPEGDADLILERLIDEQASRHVTVVSSDRRVQSAARTGHVKFVSSQSFLDRLGRRRVAAPAGGRDPKEQGLTPEEARAWMKLFGPLPLEELSPASDPRPGDVPTASRAGIGESTPPARPASPATTLHPRSSRRNASRHSQQHDDDVKPVVDDLTYWLSVFGYLDRAE